MALLVQFNNAVKPLLVFAAAPYGVIGSLIALSIMHTPFGFMAFLGIASLIGVIVSHVIVLFDFIEEMHAKGEPLEQALPDAGIQRIRPVLITVGATILALLPLAIEGGPLWQPLCYAQIGGLAVATFITLLLVPVLYSIFVLDLKIIRWETNQPPAETEALPAPEWFVEDFAMILFNQIAAAVLLLSLTLCLQCAGVITLFEWLKRVLTRDVHKHGPVYSASLVVRSAVAIVILHGLVTSLWAGFTGRIASRHGSSPFTSPRAATQLSDMVI